MLWALVEGESRSTATLIASGARPLPKSSREYCLQWLYREVLEMVTTHDPQAVHLSEAEAGQTMKAATLERAQMDGVVLAAVAQTSPNVQSYKWPTLRSRFKLKAKDDIVQYASSLTAFSSVPKSRIVPVIVALAELPQ